MKFYEWYSQALGGVIGIVSCIYCYLNGNLLIFSNLDGNFDLISFNGILASYILYPLCFLTFIMAILLTIPNMPQKKIINIEITKINSAILYLTVIIGILGCNIYFIIPALLLLLKDIVTLFKYYQFKTNNNANSNIQEQENNNTEENRQEAKLEEELVKGNPKLLFTKTEMAMDLLNENANINFITEVTGLSKDYIDNLNSNKENVNKK